MDIKEKIQNFHIENQKIKNYSKNFNRISRINSNIIEVFLLFLFIYLAVIECSNFIDSVVLTEELAQDNDFSRFYMDLLFHLKDLTLVFFFSVVLSLQSFLACLASVPESLINKIIINDVDKLEYKNYEFKAVMKSIFLLIYSGSFLFLSFDGDDISFISAYLNPWFYVPIILITLRFIVNYLFASGKMRKHLKIDENEKFNFRAGLEIINEKRKMKRDLYERQLEKNKENREAILNDEEVINFLIFKDENELNEAERSMKKIVIEKIEKEHKEKSAVEEYMEVQRNKNKKTITV